jgi:hypothetical protein
MVENRALSQEGTETSPKAGSCQRYHRPRIMMLRLGLLGVAESQGDHLERHQVGKHCKEMSDDDP